MNSLIAVMAAVVMLISTPACTKQKRENENGPGVAANTSSGANTAYAAETSAQLAKPKVLNIKSVISGERGKAQDFTWEENGKTFSFSDLTKNKVVFLNFWGTWCGPCRQEIPDIIKIDKELKGKDFVIIGIALERDMANAITNVQNFAESRGIQYINFIGKSDIVNAYGGIGGVPTTYIIDKTGSVNEVIVGARPYNVFMQSIERAMKN